MPDEKLLDEVLRAEKTFRRANRRRDLALMKALAGGWSASALGRELGITRQAVTLRAKRAAREPGS
jgi:hypothetical protein